ncbi:hypothetical protein CMO91_01405 [Candidatus Woesearchaeota archaeon]|nr:hypothetical protein [Candidatus Woesearchaeota archaeon]|tara:strand:+ start:129 stop:722 length:594 start_codon:yes stop_codon:yes gene_type:complete
MTTNTQSILDEIIHPETFRTDYEKVWRRGEAGEILSVGGGNYDTPDPEGTVNEQLRKRADEFRRQDKDPVQELAPAMQELEEIFLYRAEAFYHADDLLGRVCEAQSAALLLEEFGHDATNFRRQTGERYMHMFTEFVANGANDKTRNLDEYLERHGRGTGVNWDAFYETFPVLGTDDNAEVMVKIAELMTPMQVEDR